MLVHEGAVKLQAAVVVVLCSQSCCWRMFKYRIRLFFNELKVLLLMRSGSSSSSSSSIRTDTGTDPQPHTRMRGLPIGDCGWPPLSCSHRDDEEEYYGSDPRPCSLALEDKEEGDKPQGGGEGGEGGGLDATSLPSLSESGSNSPQCRICFQGPEKVKFSHWDVNVALTLGSGSQLGNVEVCKVPWVPLKPLQGVVFCSWAPWQNKRLRTRGVKIKEEQSRSHKFTSLYKFQRNASESKITL